jgi:hypothetical protein
LFGNLSTACFFRSAACEKAAERQVLTSFSRLS